MLDKMNNFNLIAYNYFLFLSRSKVGSHLKGRQIIKIISSTAKWHVCLLVVKVIIEGLRATSS